MYHIYETKGFVLQSTPVGEANKRYVLYTSDMGLIYANAQGVRLSKSKLRHNLNDFNHCYFSLVRGKEFWRITGAKEYSGDKSFVAQKIVLFARVAKLLKRLCTGEEKNEYLYKAIESGFSLLQEVSGEDKMRNLEILIVVKILYALGYVKKDELNNTVLLSAEIKDEDMNFITKHKNSVLKAINNAIKESQL